MGLMVLSHPIIEVLYQRGAFGAVDTANTALALAIYAAGLPAFVLQKVMQPLYFAREDTRSPFRYAVWSMVTNAVLAVGLMPLIGFTAAALATTLSAWIMVGQLWWGARRMGPEAQFDDRLMSRLPLVLMACVAMVLVIWAGALLLQPWLQAAGWRYPALALLVALGGVAYFGSGFALKAFRWSELKGLRGQR
jgi:putative peptidoglycan lipid II flippase